MPKIKKPLMLTTERRFLIMETFFAMKIRSVQKTSEIVGTRYWATNNVIKDYFKNDGLIIKSKI